MSLTPTPTLLGARIRARRARRRVFTMPVIATLALGSLLGPLVATQPAFAADTAGMTITKTASKTDLVRGDRFNYSIQVGCSVFDQECINATLRDSIPPQFIVGDADTINLTPAVPADISIDGQTVTVAFQEPLKDPIGQVGLSNEIVTITIPVTVRQNLPFTPTPLTIPNRATVDSDNTAPQESSVDVTLTVPLELGTTASKSFTPSTVLGAVGWPTTVTVGGTNESNSPVDTFTIQDPETPAIATGIFAETLLVDSLATVVRPAGANLATVSVWDATVPGWVAAGPVAAAGPLSFPPGVLATNIRGVRIAFTSGGSAAIPTGATASFELATTVRAAGSGARSNTSTSTVAIGAITAMDTEERSLVLEPATARVSAGKTIAPDRISTVAFETNNKTTAVVTLTGSNAGSVPLRSLTISEPSDPTILDSTNPLAPAHLGGGLIFSGFATAPGSILWPSGATSAAVVYYYFDGTTSTNSTPTANTLPPPVGGKRVTGFSVTFTGDSIPSGAAATIPFTVTANTVQVAPLLRVDYSNTVAVDGMDIFNAPVPPATATDTVTVFADQVAISTAKSLTRNALAAIPGQLTTATLSTTIAAYPESTRRVQTISQFDPPLAETGLTDWYRYFDATQLTLTNVPSGATLTVKYRDAVGDYFDLPGFVDLTAGPLTIPIDSALRDGVYGLQLLWTAAPGSFFVPGQTLTSNIDYSLRRTLRETVNPQPNVNATLTNCSSAIASANDIADATAVRSCIDATLTATGGGGGGGGGGNISVAKRFLATATEPVSDQTLINTRSSAQTRVRLTWSTGGLTGVESMVVTDSAPTPIDYTKGMYDAFNLSEIRAITPALDPQLQFDRVAVELFNGAAWVTPPEWLTGLPATGRNCTVANPCSTFPLTTLIPSQTELYLGIRFIFSERPGRVGLDPAPGSGVSSLTGDRNIDLVFQIRDSLRSNPTTPVVNGYRYNTDLNVANSVVRNDVDARAILSGVTLTAAANDTIQLQDPELAISTTKIWDGGPLAVPSATTTPLPTSRVTLTTRNLTVGGIVSNLTIVEPNPTSATPNGSPFNHFNLTHFIATPVTHPAGATSLTVTVRNGAGTVIRTSGPPAAPSVAWSDAVSWNAADLVNAESFTLDYGGRMATNAAATVQFDLTLRSTLRSGDSVTPDIVNNSVQGTVSDLRFISDTLNPVFGPRERIDRAPASIVLAASNIGVTATKAFASPASQVEPNRAPITVTLGAEPSGNERIESITLTDDRATFWNSFNLVSKGDIRLPTFSSVGGAAVLQVEACTGGDFIASDIDADPTLGCEARSGLWSGAGTWLTQAQLDSGLFLPGAVSAADVTGLRLTIKRSDDAQWENYSPASVSIPLSVQRRENLRRGGPVPSDYAGNLAAPGEPSAGTTTNGVTASVLGIWGGRASNSALATYRYIHQSTSVQVRKLPTGVRSPGVGIPYTLTMLNTGQRPILNPVITDTLPTDVNGAMLIFNPDATTNYTFALSGGSVPSGSTPLPTGVNPAGVTITPTIPVPGGGPTSIRFAFPAGTVLGVDQSYTITVPLFFRPGLTEGIRVNNDFEIRGDRIFTTCTAPSGGLPAVPTSSGFGCATSTSVQLLRAPALRAFISVKAEATSGIAFPTNQFTGGTQADCLAARDGAGFSRPPCAPTTIPGQEETWRYTLQNTGTTSLRQLVVATRFPTTGDQTIVSKLTRNSQWLAQFTGTIATSFPIGTVVTTYFTTAPVPCRLVLQNPSNPAACGDVPGVGWELVPLGGLANPAIVTGLQFIVVFPDGNLFDPAESATIDLTTRTIAQVRVFNGLAGSDPLAVNSLSASGISVSGATASAIAALDYSQARVGLATGSVVINKTVTGPADGFVPVGQVFTGQLVCTSLGERFERPWTIARTAPTVTINNLPGGSICTVTETNASGQTTATLTPTSVVVDPLAGPTALPTITLTNDYQFAGLLVEKTVTAGPGVVVPTAFQFTVSCSFLGTTVPLGADASFALNAGQSKTITGIPANSTCLVTETNNRGADVTVVNATTDTDIVQGSSVIENDSPPAVRPTAEFIRLSPSQIAGATINRVEFNNRFAAPALVTLGKAFDGGAASVTQFGRTSTYTVLMRCEFQNTVQYSGSVALSTANGFSVSVPNILPGSLCTVTEPDLNGADAMVITVDGVETNTFIVPASSPAVPSPVVRVVVTNWFLTGSLNVTKRFAGDVGAIDKFVTTAVPAVEFTVQLVCMRGRVPVNLPGGNSRVVTATAPVARYTEISSGAVCTLTETDSGGAISWQVLSSGGAPVVDGRFTVVVDSTTRPLLRTDQPQPDLTLENTFRFADVSVAKTIAPDPQRTDWGPFEFTLACTLDGRAIKAKEPAERSIGAREVATWTELAEGADCFITETETGGSLRIDHTVTLANGAQSDPVVGNVVALAPLRGLADEPNRATFINWYALPNTGSSTASLTPMMLAFAAIGLFGGAGLLGYGALRRSRRRPAHAAA